LLDDEVGINLWNHVHEIWICPEIERRRENGVLPKDFGLYAAQILSYTDGRDTEIRLNREVRASLLGVASKTLKPNERFILEDGISEIKDIQLSEDDDPNAGHLTLLKFKGKWILVFDFRYNKANGFPHEGSYNDLFGTKSMQLLTDYGNSLNNEMTK